MQQIHDVPLEAATISGASRSKRIYTILTPLIIQTLHAVGAYRLAFLFEELPISLLLRSSDVPLLAPYLSELTVQGNFPHSRPSAH